MKLLTTDELHYVQYKDAFFDPKNMTGGNRFDEILDVFDRMILVGRCKKVFQEPQCQRVDNDRIEFFPVTDFNGYKHVFRRLKTFCDCNRSVGIADRYWLRAPGFMSSMIGFWLRRAGIPYFSHLVGNIGDIAEVTMERFPACVAKSTRKVVDYKFKQYMKGCWGSLSVTENILQSLYPSSCPCNDIGASDVRLDNTFFQKTRRNYNPEIFEIINVATLEPYKGHKYLLKALNQIKNQRAWQLHLVGEGQLLASLKSLSKELEISDRVVFHGHLGMNTGIKQLLDNCHLFVLSSFQEGMPRVVLEAMARALPVISTDVGGVYEVIPEQWLVSRKDSIALAEKIALLWNDPALLEASSRQNYEKVQAFRLDRLGKLRREWLTWMKVHGHEADNVSWAEYRSKLI